MPPQEADVFSIETFVAAETTAALEGRRVQPRGIDSLESLRQHGFFVTRCMPFWYVCILEFLARIDERHYSSLFKKGVQGQKLPSYDEKRRISAVAKRDCLWGLACGPVTTLMRDLGLGEGREADVLAVLKSLERLSAALTLGLQGYHCDQDATFDWGEGYGFSCITAGSRVVKLDVYAGSFDGQPRGRPARVTIQPGETIVFCGLLRHRGVGYPYLSIRFFMSFVSKDALRRATEVDKEAETNQLEYRHKPEPDGIPWLNWLQTLKLRRSARLG